MTLTQHLAALRNQIRSETFQRPRTGCISGLTKTQAENVLDWLEAHGYRHCEVSYVNEKGFVVRYR